MALKDKIEPILEFINSKDEFTEFNKKIFEILEGDLIKYIEMALRKQLISQTAFASAREGISPINIIKKVTDKTTKLYASPPTRRVFVGGVESEKDQMIVDFYVDHLNVNKYMNEFNYFLNSTKMSNIEPYADSDGRPKLRVIPSHKFLVWSDDIIEPNKRTVYIKFMGESDFSGRSLNIYFLYSDEEFLAINSDGDILQEFMEENKGVNVFGTIPSTYGNLSDYTLLPTPDTDLPQMGILIPLMFTHSNDAIKYMSYSIVYGIDVDSENLERNPNVFWVFKSDGDKKPEIGQIKPEVDTTKVIENIMVQLDAWLETKGIKVSNAGRARADNSMAGVSLMIKEMDTIQSLKTQIPILEEAEGSFWKMMAKVHNTWLAQGVVRNMPQLNEDIEVKVEYELPKPIENEDERLDRAIKAKNEGMATIEDALKIWKPRLTDKELAQKMVELGAINDIEIREEDA